MLWETTQIQYGGMVQLTIILHKSYVQLYYIFCTLMPCRVSLNIEESSGFILRQGRRNLLRGLPNNNAVSVYCSRWASMPKIAKLSTHAMRCFHTPPPINTIRSQSSRRTTLTSTDGWRIILRILHIRYVSCVVAYLFSAHRLQGFHTSS
jgi:hypothetical protein